MLIGLLSLRGIGLDGKRHTDDAKPAERPADRPADQNDSA